MIQVILFTIKLLIELKKCKQSKFKNRFDFNLVWENQSTKAFRAKSRFPFPTVLPSVNLIIIFSQCQCLGGPLKRDSWRWQAMANCARNYVLVQWSMKTAQGDGLLGP